MNLFEDTDFIFTRGPSGKIQSGGFTIFNRLLNSKVHPMYTINQMKPNSSSNEMKNVSSMFEGFVVPIGLHLSQDEKEKSNADQSDQEEKEEDEENDVYETLLALKGDNEPNSSILKRKSTMKNHFQLKQTAQRKTKKIKPSK
jgi:hypothetical protein